jgi:hypothetical protein
MVDRSALSSCSIFSQEHRDTKNGFSLRGEDAGTGVSSTHCPEAVHFSNPKRGIPESRHAEALEGKGDNEAMRESYWKSAVERAGARHRRSYQTRFFGAIEMMISAGELPM